MKKEDKVKWDVFIGSSVQPIHPSDLLASSTDTCIFLSKRSLLVMNTTLQTLKSCLIEDEKVLTTAYYNELELFFVNTDKNLIIVNKDAEIVGKQKFTELSEVSNLLVLGMEDSREGFSNVRKDRMIYANDEYTFEVQIRCNYEISMLKSKNVSKIQIEFIGQTRIINYEWTCSFRYLSKSRLLISWNQNQTFIFETPTKNSEETTKLFTYEKILRKNRMFETDNKITCFEASTRHRLLIAGFLIGSIKLYKLDETKKYIGELKGHQKECTGLFIPDSNLDLVYSCGLDNSIRVWDLYDFGQVYYLRFDLICSRMDIINESLFFAKSIDNRKSFFIKSNVNLLKPILSEPKSGKVVDLICDGHWLVSLYSNNFVEGFLLKEKMSEKREINEKIEFPIQYGFLRSATKIKDQVYAIALQKGFSLIKLNRNESAENFELKKLVYNHTLKVKPNENGALVEIIHEKLLDTYFFTVLEDWKNITVAINVTAVSFLLSANLPKWDIDVRGKNKIDEKESDYVILGTDRGFVYFVNIKNRTHYHTRVNFHSSPIEQLYHIHIKNTNNFCFLSKSSQQEIAIWELSEREGPILLFKTIYTRDIQIIKPVENYLAIGCKSGQFNIFSMEKNGDDEIEFNEYANNKDEGHLKCVISIDYLRFGYDLWMTAGDDQILKIWKGIKKELLIELRVFSLINYSVFSKNSIDIILSHGEHGQISIISTNEVEQLREVKNYLENSFQLQSEDSFENNLNKVDFREFLSIEIEASSPRSPKKKDREGHIRDSNHFKNNEIRKTLNRSLDLPSLPKSEKKISEKKAFKLTKHLTPTKDFSIEENVPDLLLPKIRSRNSFFVSHRIAKEQNEKKKEKLKDEKLENMNSFKESLLLNGVEAYRLETFSRVRNFKL